MFNFKERIVKFSDGDYGIQTRGGWFETPHFLWLDGSDSSTTKKPYFKRYCKHKDFHVVAEIFMQRNLTFKPI